MTTARGSVTRDAYAILVALAEMPQTGSEIQTHIIGDTLGTYIKASSLYTSLKRLTNLGWVACEDRHYTLTDRGWHVLKTETQSLDLLVSHAKHRVVARGRGQ